ncbi:type II toxin-antitoxin system VapC family toxin [Svornostia abyssi]|uniref:Ribonuclease VapC n=1 Tax=Svornostia abyssi TaxID=2898438 RepID=A0ABY5PLE9_9ACTN|nr:type II toxin-antitoxin system VapC family toxin [Parviterribacteraceae bacterium J379]
MITYVDTSSLLKLIIEEEGSDSVGLIWDAADVVASAAMIVVEARAALAAAKRATRLSAAQHRRAKDELAELVDELTLVPVSERLIAEAADLAEREALRGYDAVHLAAALTINATILTSADTALCTAAARHRLHVANPLAA